MKPATTAREALMAEAIGDVAKLIRDVEALTPSLNESCQALQQASTGLCDGLAGFERRIAVITERAKTHAVRHMAERVDEVAQASADVQSRAIADAARVAFGAELGATMQRLQVTLQPLINRRKPFWDPWLTHAAVAALASATTWILTAHLVVR